MKRVAVFASVVCGFGLLFLAVHTPPSVLLVSNQKAEAVRGGTLPYCDSWLNTMDCGTMSSTEHMCIAYEIGGNWNCLEDECNGFACSGGQVYQWCESWHPDFAVDKLNCIFIPMDCGIPTLYTGACQLFVAPDGTVSCSCEQSMPGTNECQGYSEQIFNWEDCTEWVLT